MWQACSKYACPCHKLQVAVQGRKGDIQAGDAPLACNPNLSSPATLVPDLLAPAVKNRRLPRAAAAAAVGSEESINLYINLEYGR